MRKRNKRNKRNKRKPLYREASRLGDDPALIAQRKVEAYENMVGFYDNFSPRLRKFLWDYSVYPWQIEQLLASGFSEEAIMAALRREAKKDQEDQEDQEIVHSEKR